MREDLCGDGLTSTRVLACAVRLLDLGFFRIGGEQYASENQSYGLATLRKEHVTVSRDGELTFEFAGSADINGYLRTVTGGDDTAKDFRTWSATVLAAVGLAVTIARDLELLGADTSYGSPAFQGASRRPSWRC